MVLYRKIQTQNFTETENGFFLELTADCFQNVHLHLHRKNHNSFQSL